MYTNSQYPCLLSLSTAVPKYQINQSEVKELARNIFKTRPKTFERLSYAYDNAGINSRYSCVPIEWYKKEHGWKERSELFVQHGIQLLKIVAQNALDKARLTPDKIDGIVTVSSTGISVPSLDALLMEHIPFRRNIQRLPIFGFGCGGGVLGLSRAAALARAEPGSRWLFLIVELCGLTFRNSDLSKSNIIATALFGDGAAGGVIETREKGNRILTTGEYCIPNSIDVMGWNIEDDGFGVKFSKDIPNILNTELRPVLDAFLLSAKIPFNKINQFIFHPGGAKVLNELENTLEITPPGLIAARNVLREYGNMSAATVLFVLKRMLKNQNKSKSLLGALGPGFTASFALMDHC